MDFTAAISFEVAPSLYDNLVPFDNSPSNAGSPANSCKSNFSLSLPPNFHFYKHILLHCQLYQLVQL